MLLSRRRLKLETERMTLRSPIHSDYRPWVALRSASRAFLTPWEPEWAADHLSRKAFSNRVYWANRSINAGTALPLFLVRRSDQMLLGAITLDNIRRGPALAGTLGYWTGETFARRGYMREAIETVVHYAFNHLDLSRIEAACLPKNAPSRGLLRQKCAMAKSGWTINPCTTCPLTRRRKQGLAWCQKTAALFPA